MSHTTSTPYYLRDLVAVLDIKFYSNMNLLVANDMAPQSTRPRTTLWYIAVDIQLRDAHDMWSTL